MKFENEFYCRARRRMVSINKCSIDYMEINAKVERKSFCYRCPQGRRIRMEIASDVDPSFRKNISFDRIHKEKSA